MFELLFTDYTTQIVVVGSAMIGAVTGMLGCFAYLRKQSLAGDVVSHATLLGIVVAFWLNWLVTGSGSKSLVVIIPGAIIAGLASLLLTRLITTTTRIKPDAGLGVMLAIFFGSGLLMLRWVQRAQPPISGSAGLENYLFGMAAAMTITDLWMIGLLGGSALLTLLLCWTQLKVLTFDAEFARSLGLPAHRIETLLLALFVVSIVIGLQIVGVILMIAMLVAPAAAARQWTQKLGPMVWIAGGIGSVTAAIGALVSANQNHLPTGPVIVLLSTIVVGGSVLFAPARGILWRQKHVS